MNCCQRPKAEGNSSSEGPTDHLLPENPDNNCFVIPHFLELCSMMNGQAPDKMIHYTTQNVITFFFFLSLMNHFSRQNTNAIAYKITDFFFFKPHSRYCQQKFLKTMHIFVTPTDVFFSPIVKRLFNRPETLVQYILCRLDNIFCVLTVPVIKNYIYFLFRSASNHLLGVRNDRRHL